MSGKNESSRKRLGSSRRSRDCMAKLKEYVMVIIISGIFVIIIIHERKSKMSMRK